MWRAPKSECNSKQDALGDDGHGGEWMESRIGGDCTALGTRTPLRKMPVFPFPPSVSSRNSVFPCFGGDGHGVLWDEWKIHCFEDVEHSIAGGIAATLPWGGNCFGDEEHGKERDG